MIPFPSAMTPLLLSFSYAFSQPTFERWLLLCMAAILTTGRRTISNLLRTAAMLAQGHPSSYHRVFSRRCWSTWALGYALAWFILSHLVPEGIVYLAGDDTVEQHKGKKVFGKARHRDALRSTHTYTAHIWGHKWVVLAVLVKFPFAHRPWALPVLVALYRSRESNRERHRRHKTPPQLMRLLLAVLIRWFPDRKFVFAGDGGFSTHELAAFAHRQSPRLTMVGRFYADANLYAAPPKSRGKVGRPRTKGAKLPSPEQVVPCSKPHRISVCWYGGGMRKVEVVSDKGHWYKAGEGLVLLRWVYVHDLTGTHRDEYFFSTDISMTAKQIIETYTGRWSLEVTFEEARAYLGLGSTRGWSEKTVLRVAPCLFGLFSLVAALYAMLPKRKRRRTSVHWSGKSETTFSDAIASVRRWLWIEWIFKASGHNAVFSKLPASFREILLFGLAPAA